MDDEEIIEGQINVFELPDVEFVEHNNQLNEILGTETDFKITNGDDNITELVEDAAQKINNSTSFSVNDKVEFEFEGVKEVGRVTRIYNKGETINVQWKGKRSAFYYKSLRKVD